MNFSDNYQDDPRAGLRGLLMPVKASGVIDPQADNDVNKSADMFGDDFLKKLSTALPAALTKFMQDNPVYGQPGMQQQQSSGSSAPFGYNSDGTRRDAPETNLSDYEWGLVKEMRDKDGFFGNAFDSNSLKAVGAAFGGLLAGSPIAGISAAIPYGKAAMDSLVDFGSAKGGPVDNTVMDRWDAAAKADTQPQTVSLQKEADAWRGWLTSENEMTTPTSSGSSSYDSSESSSPFSNTSYADGTSFYSSDYSRGDGGQ